MRGLLRLAVCALVVAIAAPAALAGTLTPSPATRAFGTVSVSGAAASSTVVITNTTSPTTITGFSLGAGCGEFTATAAGLPVTLNNGNNIAVTVTYDPVDRSTDACTVTILDDNGVTNTFGLTGTGTAPLLSVTGGPLAFANQRWNGGPPQALTLTLINNGNEPITASQLTLTFLTGVDFAAGPINLPIPAGGSSRTVQITFDPTSGGAKSDTLVFAVANDLPTDPNPSATMSGIGTESVLTFSDDPLGFGVNGAASMVVGNLVGTASLNLASLTITGTDASDFVFTDHGCTGQVCAPPVPAAIAAGASSTFALDCVPTGSGARTATLTVVSDDPGSPMAATLQCTGASGITVLPSTSVAFAAQRVGTTSTFQTVTISNAAGAAPLHYAASSSGAEWPLSCAGGGAACLADTVPAGGSAQLRVSFAPAATGARTGTLTITSDDPIEPVTNLALTGTGTQSNLVVASPLAFGNVPVAQAGGATQPLTLSSTGTATLNVSAMTIAGDPSFSFAFGTCTSGQTCAQPIAIPVGNQATIALRCDPSSAGPKIATLTITSDDPSSPATVALTCDGTVPDVAVSPTSLAFGAQRVGTSAAQTVTVSNASGAGIPPLTFALSEASPSLSLSCTPTCSGSLAAGEAAIVTVTFTPASVGDVTTSVVVTTDDPDEPTTIVDVSGTGVRPVIARVAPATLPLALGNVPVGGASAPGAVSVENIGTMTLSIGSVALVGPDAAELAITSGGTGAQAVAPSATASWTVTCNPTSRGGKAATLRITSDSDDDPATAGIDESAPLDVPVTCTGQEAELAVSDAAFDFGAVAVGASGARTLTITNVGNIPAAITGLPVSNAVFTAIPSTGTLPVVVGAGATVTVDVGFSPVTGNVETAVLTIENDGSVQPQVALTGDGLLTGLAVTPDPVAFGSVRLDTPQTLTVTLDNTGEAPLTVTAVTVDNAADFAVVGIATPVVVPAGGAVAFQLRAQPMMLGARSATVTIATDLLAPRAVAATAVGIAPDIEIQTQDGTPTDGAFAFGGLDVVAAPVVGTITVTNTGTAPLALTSCTLGGAGVFALTGSVVCPTTVAVGGAIDLEVTFDPTVEAMAAGTLTIVSDAGTAAIPLAGIGLDRHLALSTLALAFPDTYRHPTTPAVMTVTVTNVPPAGFEPGATLHLSMVTTTGAGFSVVGPTTLTIAGGGMADLEVAFAPDSAAAFAGTLTIVDDDTALPMAEVALSGTGISRVVAVSPTSVDFGRTDVDTPVRLSALGSAIVVVNQSATDAFVIRRLAITDTSGQEMTAGPFLVIGPSTDLALAPGATLVIDLQLASAQPATYAGNLVIYLDDDPDPHAMVRLGGEVTGGGGCGCRSGADPGGAVLVACVLMLVMRRRRRGRVAR